MAFGWIRADDDDGIGFHHGVERLRAGRFTDGVLQSVTGGGVTYSGARVHVVVAERGTNHFLHQKRLFVGAARRGDAADRVSPVLGLDASELAGCVADRFVPADLLPRLVYRTPDHWRGDTIGMCRVAEGEAPFDAGVPMIRMAVSIGRHAHHLTVLYFRIERTANATICASRRRNAFGPAHRDDGLLGQRDGRTSLDAGAARYALGCQEGLVLAGRHVGFESPPLDGQRKRSLDLVARPHASRTDDAHRGVEVEVGIARVCRQLLVVLAAQSVPRLGEVEVFGHVLKLAVAIGRARHAVERVIGDIKLHHTATELRELRRFGVYLDPVRDESRARSRIPLAAPDPTQTQPASPN